MLLSLATTISFETIPSSLVEMRQRIEHTLNNFPWLVYEDKGELLGYAYAASIVSVRPTSWSVDVSIYIHEQSHRQGIGRKLYTALFELLKRRVSIMYTLVSHSLTRPVLLSMRQWGCNRLGSIKR